MLCKTIGNVIEVKQRNHPANILGGVEVDYYFMATRFGGSSVEISMTLWTMIVDEEGFVYAMRTRHIGPYDNWKEVIRDRIEQHLYKLKLDGLFVRRMVRDIDIKKEGHIISHDPRSAGDNIGIDGSNEVFLRRSKFSYLS
ncbi:hypothetical protein ACNKXS_03645 [Christiangramia marina]|uniref:hypothetical protein n=1 Tax=Christiangramia marina TaxID=409436 RepID=UPI003AA7EF05